MKDKKIPTLITIKTSEKEILKELAWKNKKSFSRYIIDTALKNK